MAQRKLVDIGKKNYSRINDIIKKWKPLTSPPSVPWLVQLALEKGLYVVEAELHDQKLIKE